MSELYHHGVKGMKWGVRKYQNQDESPKTNRTNKKKMSAAKKVAIGASVVASITAGSYIYSKWAVDNKDMIVKGEKVFQRLTREGVADQSSYMYTSVRKKDSAKYLKGFVDELRNRHVGTDKSGIILTKYKSKSPVKIANKKSAEKIYDELIKSDSEFRDFFGGMSYKSFNEGIPSYFKNLGHLTEKYVQALSDAGYDGVIDEYDKHHGSFRAMAPIIFEKGKLYVDSVTKIR